MNQRPITASGRERLQLVGGTDAPKAAKGWSDRIDNQGTSGTMPRARAIRTPRQAPLTWYGLAATYIREGLPQLSNDFKAYEIVNHGFTEDGLQAIAYQCACERLTGTKPTVLYSGRAR